MKSIVIVDTETTGTEHDALCVEVALVFYSVEHASPVRSYASLLRASENPAEKCNGIPAALLADAPEPAVVWAQARRFVEAADALVAHNAEFDSRFVPAGVVAGKPWICSMDDLAWPRAEKPGEGLVKLALAHGLGVATAHRAMADCDLLARLFTRVREMGVDLVPFLARGLRQKTRLVVAARGFDEKRNELAKAAGFKWDAERKEWWRRMVLEDAAALPFETREVA